MSYTAITAVDAAKQRLKAKLLQLDHIGTSGHSASATSHLVGNSVVSTDNRFVIHRAELRSPTPASARVVVSVPSSRQLPSKHVDPIGADQVRPARERSEPSTQRQVRSLVQTPGNLRSSTPLAMVKQQKTSNSHNHNDLVSSIMRDFGFMYPPSTRAGVVPGPSIDNGVPHTTTVPETSAIQVLDSVLSLHGNSYVELQPTSAGGHNNTTVVPEVSALQRSGTPRPQTPPHHVLSHPQVQQKTASSTLPREPDVLVVAGFEDETDTVNASTLNTSRPSSRPQEKQAAVRSGSRASPSRRRPENNTIAGVSLGLPTFSSAAIADLLAKANTGLPAAKRDELFAVAQRAYEGIVGPKNSTTSIYKSYPNVCRVAERNLPPGAAVSNLKSVDGVFQAIVGYTTLQHQIGNVVSDQRAVHKKRVVPGGCSESAAAVISRRMGRMGQLLRVMPYRASVAETLPSSSQHAHASRSPPRWPRRVVSTPFVTENLSRDESKVRHVSAPRRSLHPSAVKGPTRSGSAR